MPVWVGPHRSPPQKVEQCRPSARHAPMQVERYLSAALGPGRLAAHSQALCRPSLRVSVRLNTLKGPPEVRGRAVCWWRQRLLACFSPPRATAPRHCPAHGP